MRWWCAVCLAVLAAGTGCGYHTAGSAVRLPENVKTIAVPAFTNVTTTYRIEQMLTTAVVREFTTRTHYHILNEPGEAADATLRGTVISTSASPLTYNSATGQAASVLVVVSMKFRRTWQVFLRKILRPTGGSPRILHVPWSLTFWRASRC
jgi:hypothetical protein